MTESLTNVVPLQTLLPASHLSPMCHLLIDQSLRDGWSLPVISRKSSAMWNFKSCQDLGVHEDDGVVLESFHQKDRHPWVRTGSSWRGSQHGSERASRESDCDTEVRREALRKTWYSRIFLQKRSSYIKSDVK